MVVLGCAMAAAACSRQPEPTEHRVTVVPTRITPGRTLAASSPPAATPAPAATRVLPRRAFVDPPLPAELVDPPGLLPLPPSPAFNTADHPQEGTRP